MVLFWLASLLLTLTFPSGALLPTTMGFGKGYKVKRKRVAGLRHRRVIGHFGPLRQQGAKPDPLVMTLFTS